MVRSGVGGSKGFGVVVRVCGMVEEALGQVTVMLNWFRIFGRGVGGLWGAEGWVGWAWVDEMWRYLMCDYFQLNRESFWGYLLKRITGKHIFHERSF